MNKTYLFILTWLAAWFLAADCWAESITTGMFTKHQIEGLQSQTTNSLVVDKLGFVWISNRNGIDRYNGMVNYHYKISEQDKRGYRDGMMIQMHVDKAGRVWAYTERGIIYRFFPADDKFSPVVDLYSFEKWNSIQSLYVTDNDILVIGVNEGVICYDLTQKKIVAHVAQDCNVQCITPYDQERLLVGSDKGIFLLDKKTFQNGLPSLSMLPVNSCVITGEIVWIGTRGRGLYYFSKSNLKDMKRVEGSESMLINAMTYDSRYGLLLATDGNGLLQLDLDKVTYLPEAPLTAIAYDHKDAIVPTLSGAINDVMVDHENIWISMYMGGCIQLEPCHNLVTLTNPMAESPSDNFVYDLDYGADGDLWVAFNQAIVRYDAEGQDPQVYMNRESRFLTLKVMPDSTVWAGGFGTGLYHFDPKTGEKEWFSSVADSPTNDNIYDLHDSPDGDLWVAGLNFPLTRLHFLPDGTFEKKHYPDIVQAFDAESLNQDTLVLATSDGFWMLNVVTGEKSHHLQTGEKGQWQGTNFVRSLTCRNGREIWAGTAGAGLVCYDVRTDHYDYYDDLNTLPSLEIRSVLMLNDSILCASTEDNGVFSFNTRTRHTERSLLLEDEMLNQEFLQNSGIRQKNGNLLFGGNRGGVVLTPRDILGSSNHYRIFIVGRKPMGLEYSIGYRHNNFSVEFCTNDIYHQADYKFEYRIEGWMDEWMQLNEDRTLRLVNMPPGDWDLEVRAINSNKFELGETLHLHVNNPIWKRWYAWTAYVLFFFWLVLKIVLYLLRPRIEDM